MPHPIIPDDGMHVYEPSSGHGLRHDPFNAIVGPRPIGWIASRSPAGILNLAPYSFFNAFNYTPPIIGFSSTGWKDSVANIADTREFVWNLATRPLAEPMNASAATTGPEVDEFALAGLTPMPPRGGAAPPPPRRTRPGATHPPPPPPPRRGGGPTAYVEVEPGAFFHLARPDKGSLPPR